VFQEVLSTLYFLERRIPALSFIGGLAGSDITVNHFARAIEQTKGALLKKDMAWETIWLNEND
jgi:pyruvate ferredoxin oxidoreductase alpha subunit/phenylglyoxylate dehydrogenase alpha subunit